MNFLIENLKVGFRVGFHAMLFPVLVADEFIVKTITYRRHYPLMICSISNSALVVSCINHEERLAASVTKEWWIALFKNLLWIKITNECCTEIKIPLRVLD